MCLHATRRDPSAGCLVPARETPPAGAGSREREPGLIARIALAGIRGYKLLLSPLFAGSCRFTPSCADYMSEAIRLHGGARGTAIGLKRLVRCRPFAAWGFDPVPPPDSRHTKVL